MTSKGLLPNISALIELYKLIRLFQLRRHGFRRDFKAHISATTEANLILHLDTEPGCARSDLALALGLDLSTISREIAKLKNRGWISAKPDPEDGRRESIAITPNGYAVLAKLDHAQAALIKHFLGDSTFEEVTDLCEFLKLLLDGMGAPSLRRRPNDHPLTVELRRLGRYLDIRKDKTRTKIPIVTIHILQLLEQSHRTLSVTELSQVLGKDQANISRTVGELVRAKQIKYLSDSEDGRKRPVSLTAKGKALIEDHNEQIAKMFARALPNYKPANLRKVIAILQKITTVPGSDIHAQVVSERSEIRRMTTEKERQLLRGFYVEHQVRANKHFHLPERIFASSSANYGFFVGQRLVGAYELDRREQVINSYVTEEGKLLEEKFVDSLGR